MADPALTVRFTRLQDDRHRFEYLRPDGTGEALELDGAVVLHDNGRLHGFNGARIDRIAGGSRRGGCRLGRGRLLGGRR